MASSAPAEVLTGAYSAFGAGDMEALCGFLADNVFWQIGGTGPLDGVTRVERRCSGSSLPSRNARGAPSRSR